MRLALRHLRKPPGYALAAIVTLALAIGASTAIFSAVYAVLLKPMPIHDPGQLVVGWGTPASSGLRTLLYDVEVIDARTYMSVVVVVSAVTFIAAYLPARRAGDADPLTLLRRE
jgi:ABC-type lipoprotein release transport system permease subunit